MFIELLGGVAYLCFRNLFSNCRLNIPMPFLPGIFNRPRIWVLADARDLAELGRELVIQFFSIFALRVVVRILLRLLAVALLCFASPAWLFSGRGHLPGHSNIVQGREIQTVAVFVVQALQQGRIFILFVQALQVFHVLAQLLQHLLGILLPLVLRRLGIAPTIFLDVTRALTDLANNVGALALAFLRYSPSILSSFPFTFTFSSFPV